MIESPGVPMLAPMAEQPTSLLDLTGGLLSDPAEKAAFAADPHGYARAHGLADLSPTELRDALGYVADSLPAPLAARLATVAEADPLDGLDGIVEELGHVAALDPAGGADLELGDDPLDGFDAPDPAAWAMVDSDFAAGQGDIGGDVGGDDAGDDAGMPEAHSGGYETDLLGEHEAHADGSPVDEVSFGEGSGHDPADLADLGSSLDTDVDLGLDDHLSATDPSVPEPHLDPDPTFDPVVDLDDSVGDPVPPIEHLDDGADEPAEDTFDETDWDDSVDV
jgi:hypothetical protein